MVTCGFSVIMLIKNVKINLKSQGNDLTADDQRNIKMIHISASPSRSLSLPRALSPALSLALSFSRSLSRSLGRFLSLSHTSKVTQLSTFISHTCFVPVRFFLPSTRTHTNCITWNVSSCPSQTHNNHTHTTVAMANMTSTHPQHKPKAPSRWALHSARQHIPSVVTSLISFRHSRQSNTKPQQASITALLSQSCSRPLSLWPGEWTGSAKCNLFY